MPSHRARMQFGSTLRVVLFAAVVYIVVDPTSVAGEPSSLMRTEQVVADKNRQTSGNEAVVTVTPKADSTSALHGVPSVSLAAVASAEASSGRTVVEVAAVGADNSAPNAGGDVTTKSDVGAAHASMEVVEVTTAKGGALMEGLQSSTREFFCKDACAKCADGNHIFISRRKGSLTRLSPALALFGLLLIGVATGGIGFLFTVPAALGLAATGSAWLATSGGCGEVSFKLPSLAQYDLEDLLLLIGRETTKAQNEYKCRVLNIEPEACESMGEEQCTGCGTPETDPDKKLELALAALQGVRRMEQMSQCEALRKPRESVTEGVHSHYSAMDYTDVYAECMEATLLCGEHGGVAREKGNPVVMNLGSRGMAEKCLNGGHAFDSGRRAPRGFRPATTCTRKWLRADVMDPTKNKCSNDEVACGNAEEKKCNKEHVLACVPDTPEHRMWCADNRGKTVPSPQNNIEDHGEGPPEENDDGHENGALDEELDA